MVIQAPTNPSIIGIDVSKDKLDIFILPKGMHEVISNTKISILKWINKLGPVAEIEKIVLEPTGGYERELVNLLLEYGLPAHIAHPNCVYHFGQSKGLFAKTDKIDAHMLALYGQQEKPEINAASKEE